MPPLGFGTESFPSPGSCLICSEWHRQARRHWATALILEMGDGPWSRCPLPPPPTTIPIPSSSTATPPGLHSIPSIFYRLTAVHKFLNARRRGAQQNKQVLDSDRAGCVCIFISLCLWTDTHVINFYILEESPQVRQVLLCVQLHYNWITRWTRVEDVKLYALAFSDSAKRSLD